MNNYYSTVVNYFNNKAEQYDDVDNQLYWVFSDTFYRELLKRELPRFLNGKTEINLLDAGAGTGRWSLIFNELFGNTHSVQGVLIDISEGMLEVAKRKIISQRKVEAFTCVVGNIESMPSIADSAFEVALSFYNVISFVEQPQKALSEICKKLKKGGIHVSVVANTFHAYYFVILTNQLHILDLIRSESKVRFNDLMPAIHCFTPEKLKTTYQEAGFTTIDIFGGPNFIYPGMDETYVHGQSEGNVNKLSNPDFFKKLLRIELENYRNPAITGRGNTLIAIAQK